MILVIGLGAVGSLLATYLAAAGRDVVLYARPKDELRFHALTHMQVDFADPRQTSLRAPRPRLVTTLDLSAVRYLLICVKYPDLDALLAQLPAALPPQCTLLSTLNGVAPLRKLRQRFPQSEVLPLSIMMNGQWLAPLHVKLTTRAEIVIGSRKAELLDLFRGSGLVVKAAEGDAAVWGKLLINLANAICALTRTDFKTLFTDPNLRRVYVAVLDEATAALAAAGIAWKLPLIVPYRAYRWMLLHGGPLPWWFAHFRNGVQPGAYPSMVADVEAGRVTEVEQLNGEVCRLGEANGLATPVNRRIVQMVQSNASPDPVTAAELRQRLTI